MKLAVLSVLVSVRHAVETMTAQYQLPSQRSTPPCRLEAQDAWTRRQAATNGSAFWAALRLLHAQASTPAVHDFNICSVRMP